MFDFFQQFFFWSGVIWWAYLIAVMAWVGWEWIGDKYRPGL